MKFMQISFCKKGLAVRRNICIFAVMNYANIIANRLELNVRQVEKTIELLEQGATVPFIARYRKEATGSLNEVQIAAIRDLLLKLKELDKRREAILQSIEEQGKLTPELRKQIEAAESKIGRASCRERV